MEHNICRENLSAYLDGELPPGEKLSLESHLASCADCSRELAELKRVSAVFKEHVMRPVPDALRRAVFAEKSARTVFSGWFKPAAVLSAAAAGLLIILGLPKFRSQERTGRPEPASEAFHQEAAPREISEQKSAAAGGNFPALTAPAAGGSGGAAPAEGMRFAAPATNKSGAYGQAKFSGGSGLSAEKASALSGAAMSRGLALSSLSALAESDEKRSIPGNADRGAALPKWLYGLISRYKAGPPGDPPLTVWQYSYKGRKVYYLPPQCCGRYGELYDEDGGLLCAPDGGKNGLGDGKCADFYKVRTDGRAIWRDPRGS